MTAFERLTRLQYRFYGRVRHPDASRVAGKPGIAADFESLRSHHYCLLVTFRRSGEPVPTPVLFGLADGQLYFRSESDVAKVKRILNDPRVRVGPCDWRGKPLGTLTEGTARVLPRASDSAAYAVLKRNYTLGQRFFERFLDLLPIDFAYVEVTPGAI
jgi:PPOX class probable F420-dependent enzyme